MHVQRIYIPLPEAPARAHMFKVHLGDTPHSLTQGDFEALGRKTEGFSGSDVNVVVKDVLFEPVRKTQEATHFRCRPLGGKPSVGTGRGLVLLDGPPGVVLDGVRCRWTWFSPPGKHHAVHAPAVPLLLVQP